MELKDCKVGQIVVANSEKYGYTCKSNNYVGEIVGVNDFEIEVKTLECDAGSIGTVFGVNPIYFDLKEDMKKEVKGMNGMKIVKEGITEINFEAIKKGDAVEVKNGDVYIIASTVQGDYFRALNINTSEYTSYASSIRNLISIELGKANIKRHIPAEKITVSIEM